MNRRRGEGDLQQGMLHIELTEEHTRRPFALWTCTIHYQGSESVWVDGTSTHLQRVSSCGERSCTYISPIGCLWDLDSCKVPCLAELRKNTIRCLVTQAIYATKLCKIDVKQSSYGATVIEQPTLTTASLPHASTMLPRAVPNPF